MPRQKLYCYIDESGQDDASRVFVVVAVVSEREQDEFRRALMDIEWAAGTVEHKWHKSHSPKRLRYLELAIERKLGEDEIFFGSYPKPLPYFFPLIEVLEDAIKTKAAPSLHGAGVCGRHRPEKGGGAHERPAAARRVAGDGTEPA
jgi:Protein of unknown function (DUF3800)